MKKRSVSRSSKDVFDSLNNIVFGLYNHHSKDYESVGFDADGKLSHFTQDGVVAVSLAQSVEILHRLEREWCSDEKPFDMKHDDAGRLRWFAMLEAQLNPDSDIDKQIADMQFITSSPANLIDIELMQDRHGEFFLVTKDRQQPRTVRPMSKKAAAEWVKKEIVPRVLQPCFKVAA